MNYSNKKIIAIRLKVDSYFIVKHIDSKYYNDFTNQIIDIFQLFDEILGYASNNVICLEQIIEIKDINNNIINESELYELFNSMVIMNKLANIKTFFIKKFLIMKG
jgi:hypothetical protein